MTARVVLCIQNLNISIGYSQVVQYIWYYSTIVISLGGRYDCRKAVHELLIQPHFLTPFCFLIFPFQSTDISSPRQAVTYFHTHTQHHPPFSFTPPPHDPKDHSSFFGLLITLSLLVFSAICMVSFWPTSIQLKGMYFFICWTSPSPPQPTPTDKTNTITQNHDSLLNSHPDKHKYRYCVGFSESTSIIDSKPTSMSPAHRTPPGDIPLQHSTPRRSLQAQFHIFKYIWLSYSTPV